MKLQNHSSNGKSPSETQIKNAEIPKNGITKTTPDSQKPRAAYTRGMHKMDQSWSKDTTKSYYEGTHMTIWWPLAKTVVLIALFIILNSILGLKWHLTLLILLLVVS